MGGEHSLGPWDQLDVPENATDAQSEGRDDQCPPDDKPSDRHSDKS
jgi:hypothetical protein